MADGGREPRQTDASGEHPRDAARRLVAMGLRNTVLAIFLAGCGLSEPIPAPSASTPPRPTPNPSVGPTASSSPTGGPADSDAEIRPDLIEAHPAIAGPGDTIELAFPQSTDRSLAYAMELETADGWNYVYQLVSDQRGGEPFWQEAGGPVEIDLVGVSGPGPDRVVIPAVAALGTYRLCTMFSASSVCVVVVVRDG
jgi:hypothetical protein